MLLTLARGSLSRPGVAVSAASRPDRPVLCCPGAAPQAFRCHRSPTRRASTATAVLNGVAQRGLALRAAPSRLSSRRPAGRLPSARVAASALPNRVPAEDAPAEAVLVSSSEGGDAFQANDPVETVEVAVFSESELAAERAQLPWWRRLARSGGQAAAVAALAVALLVASPLGAEAARSGGRMGGSAFRGAATSRSYSAPSSSRSSLGGGGASMLGGGRGYGMRSSPSVVVAPSYGMSSFFFPTYGYGYGMGGGGFSLFNLLFLGFAGYVIVTAVSSMLSDTDQDGAGMGGACSVVKLQVGLLGSARGLQRDLDRIAGRADTSSPDGLSYVLQETVLALLRNPDYCVYGYSQNKKASGLDEAEAKFNEQSLGERSKFRSETLVNVGGRSKRGSYGGASSDLSNELIVVTVVAAVDGRLQLPKVESLADLRAALNKLGAVPADGLLAVEVLWTPQEEGDTFTRDEIVTDYPMLNQL